MERDQALSQHYVYLYRSISGEAMYVGYGMTVKRALDHSSVSHNSELRDWLAADQFDLSVAGPYRDEIEGKRIEAALISALQPRFNVASGSGPKFAPLGVPPQLGDRPAKPALTIAEVGIITGGALFVYLAPGDYLGDGRRKYDPANPIDDDVLSNMEGKWDIGRHINAWKADPNDSPQILLGVHGRRPAHRFIVGAAEVDTQRWSDPNLFVRERQRYFVPLSDRRNLDAKSLRGRRLDCVTFGQFSWQLHIWVDGKGRVRHPPPLT